jgi:membrane-associated phospholipid phosphatase
MRPLSLLLPLIAALATGCAVYDLDISRALADPTATWARLGERYGTLPGVYAMAASAWALNFGSSRARERTRVRQWLWQALAGLTLAVAGGVTLYRLADWRPGAGATVAAGLALSVALGWLGKRAPRFELRERAEAACRAVLTVGLTCWVVVNGLKATWGRVRFRDLDALANDFTPWYLPQGFTGHLSFPSGHAAMGWVLLPLLALFRPGSPGFVRAAVLLGGWGLFVAASRVVVGAHYASDVLFSTSLAIAVGVYLLRRQGAARPEAPRAPAPAPTSTDPG